MNSKVYNIQMEIAGNTALWTRPDSGDCPCSYPAPTYSAVCGIVDSILWNPAVLVIPQKVELCRPVRYHSYATNYGGPLRNPKSIKEGNNYQLFATVLTDVCYRIYADVVANPFKAKLPESVQRWERATTSPAHAFQDMFNRRLERGQSFGTICLGWSEFTPSYVGPFREGTAVCADMPDIKIPSMLRQVFPDGYRSCYRAVYDTNLIIHKGVLLYPPRRNSL